MAVLLPEIALESFDVYWYEWEWLGTTLSKSIPYTHRHRKIFDWGAHIRTIDNANCWTQHKNAVVMGVSGNAPQGNLLNEVESAFKVIL